MLLYNCHSGLGFKRKLSCWMKIVTCSSWILNDNCKMTQEMDIFMKC